MKGFNHLTDSMAQQFANLIRKYYDTNAKDSKKFTKILKKEILYKLTQSDNITTLILIFPRDISRRFHILSFSSIVAPMDKPDPEKGLQIILSRIELSKDLLFLLEILYNKHIASKKGESYGSAKATASILEYLKSMNYYQIQDMCITYDEMPGVKYTYCEFGTPIENE